jgi:hypothetical protein
VTPPTDLVLPTISGVQHPPWCDKTVCTASNVSGDHASGAVLLQPLAPNPLGIAVQLTQGVAIDGFPLSSAPLVAMTFSDDEGELFTPLLYMPMARRLGRLLTYYPAVLRGGAPLPPKTI